MVNEELRAVRILEYKRVLKKLKALGLKRVFSSNLGDALGVSASLVRRDFSVLTPCGNKKGGYEIDSLMDEINRYLHKDKMTKVVLAGFGKLGSALLDYKGFVEEKIEFTAAFDKNPSKFRDKKNGIPVYNVDKMATFITKNKITIGVIAVPGEVAQQMADIMVMAGIKAILNFAPTRLALPADCQENHINLALELEKLVVQASGKRKESE